MKMKNLFGMAAIAAVALSACSNDEVVQNFSQDNAIRFSTYMGRNVQSRAAELTTDGLEEKGFGVFAFYTGQDDWNTKGTNTTPNFMFNQQVTYDAQTTTSEGESAVTTGAWTYSPIKYWPTTKNDKISFFAYGPYLNYEDTPDKTVTPKKGENNVEANAVAGAPTVTFTQSSNVAKMVDFVAGVAMDQTGSENNYTSEEPKTVVFKLKHELTRLNFAAKLDRDAFKDSDDKHKTKINITSVKIDTGKDSKFYQSAEYTFATQNDETEGEITTYRGKWSKHIVANADLNLTSILNSTPASNLGGYTKSGILLSNDADGESVVHLFKQTVDATEGQAAQAADYVFLIPPVQEDGTTGLASGDVINVTFTYDIVTVDNKLSTGHSVTSATKTVALPTGATDDDATTDTDESKENTLQQGKAYKFVFTFGLHEVKVSATVEEWNATENDGGDTDVNWTDTDDEPETTSGEND